MKFNKLDATDVINILYLNDENILLKEIIINKIDPLIGSNLIIYSAFDIRIKGHNINKFSYDDIHMCNGWHANIITNEFDFLRYLQKNYFKKKINIYSFSDDCLKKIIYDARYLISNFVNKIITFNIPHEIELNQNFSTNTSRDKIYIYESNNYPISKNDNFVINFELLRKTFISNYENGFNNHNLDKIIIIITDIFGLNILGDILKVLKKTFNTKVDILIFSQFKNFNNFFYKSISKFENILDIKISSLDNFSLKKIPLYNTLLVLGLDSKLNEFYINIFGSQFRKVFCTSSDNSISRTSPRNETDKIRNLNCLFNIRIINIELPKYLLNDELAINKFIINFDSIDIKKFKLKNISGSADLTVAVLHYQRPKLAIRALQSVLSQTLLPSEILLLDDGSSNEFIFELENSLSKLDLKNIKLKLIKLENMYLGSLRNSAALNCKTKYLYFLDDDNILHPNALEYLYGYMVGSNSSVVGSYSFIAIEGEPYSFDFGRLIPFSGMGLFSGIKTNTICDGNCLVNTKDFIDIGGNSEDYKIGRDDQHFFLKLIYSDKIISIIPMGLYQAQQSIERLRNQHYSIENSFLRIFNNVNFTNFKDNYLMKEMLMSKNRNFIIENKSFKNLILNLISKLAPVKFKYFIMKSRSLNFVYNFWKFIRG